MCILCQSHADQFDVEHMKLALKKLSAQEKKDKAIDIKVALKHADKNKISGNDQSVTHLREAQYLLSQFL